MHQPSCPPSCSVCTVELQQSAHTTISADSSFDGVIFLGAGLAEFLTDFKHSLRITGHDLVFQQHRNRVFTEVGYILIGLLFKPFGKLCDAVGVFKPCKGNSLAHKSIVRVCGDFQCALHHIHINCYTASIYQQIRLPLLLDVIRNRKARQPPLNLGFGHNITDAVFLKQTPLLRVVLRKVPCSAAIALCGSAGNTEISDKGFANRQLLFLGRKTKSLACGVQSCCKTAVQTVQHRVSPLVYRQQSSIKLRQAIPFKRRIVSVFDVFRAGYRLIQPVR